MLGSIWIFLDDIFGLRVAIFPTKCHELKHSTVLADVLEMANISGADTPVQRIISRTATSRARANWRKIVLAYCWHTAGRELKKKIEIETENKWTGGFL